MELAVSRSLSEVVKARSSWRGAARVAVALVVACLCGCEGDACVRQSDCAGGQTCRLGRCVIAVDAGDGAAPDGSLDAGADAAVDAEVDAGSTDAGLDADVGLDAAPTDAGTDAGDVDAGTDAGDVDTGM